MSIGEMLRDPLFASILGIGGLVLAVVFYVKSKRTRRISATSTASVVVGTAEEADPRLKIVFDGNDVPRVTRSVFVVWNSGHETIRGSEIAPTDMLRVELPEGTTILAANVERTTREPVSFRLQEGARENRPAINILFDFLDRHDGAIFAVLHTAPTNGAALKGTIQGIPEGPILLDSSFLDLESYRVVTVRKRTAGKVFVAVLERVITGVVAIFPPFVLACGLFSGFVLQFFPSLGEPDTSWMLVPGKFNWFYIVVGGILTLFEYFLIRVWWKRPPKKLVNPKIES